MGQNSTEVAYGFGQMGSIFVATTAAIAPPKGMVIIAITAVADTLFNTESSGAAGLIAQTKKHVDGTVTGDEYGGALEIEYFGTAVAAHNASANSETALSGSGCEKFGTTILPKGLTVYGRWIGAKIVKGAIICYLGTAD